MKKRYILLLLIFSVLVGGFQFDVNPESTILFLDSGNSTKYTFIDVLINGVMVLVVGILLFFVLKKINNNENERKKGR